MAIDIDNAGVALLLTSSYDHNHEHRKLDMREATNLLVGMKANTSQQRLLDDQVCICHSQRLQTSGSEGCSLFENAKRRQQEERHYGDDGEKIDII